MKISENATKSLKSASMQILSAHLCEVLPSLYKMRDLMKEAHELVKEVSPAVKNQVIVMRVPDGIDPAAGNKMYFMYANAVCLDIEEYQSNVNLEHYRKYSTDGLSDAIYHELEDRGESVNTLSKDLCKKLLKLEKSLVAVSDIGNNFYAPSLDSVLEVSVEKILVKMKYFLMGVEVTLEFKVDDEGEFSKWNHTVEL